MKKLLTSAAVAAALSLIGASSADAAKYFLTVADPGAGLTGSPYGEVDVLGDGTSSLDITVMLYGTNEFHWTNDVNHHALAFDLVGNPTITISGLASNFSGGPTQAAGSNSASPFGAFDYAINFPKLTGPMPVIQSFNFTVTGAPHLTLETTHSSLGDTFFATDILGAGGKTGNVGAQVPFGVPEPATWALMIMGFGGAGAMLRRQRQKLATATA
ncbi:MAG: PEPxxWA-CTERM sorting domain-containing protein [Phenylobacterium sp.]